MHELDQQICIAFNEGNTVAVNALRRRVYYDFWQTPEGQKLVECADKDSALERLLSVYEQRFGNAALYPGVLLIGRLQDVAADLLAADATIVPAAEEAPSTQLSEEDEIRALADEFRRDMEDPKVLASDIRRRRESSVKHRKAWALANTPDVVPTSHALPSDDLKKFAFLVNEACRLNGISSIRPAAGVVTLVIGSKRYEYPVQLFDEKYEACVSFGLIR